MDESRMVAVLSSSCGHEWPESHGHMIQSAGVLVTCYSCGVYRSLWRDTARTASPSPRRTDSSSRWRWPEPPAEDSDTPGRPWRAASTQTGSRLEGRQTGGQIDRWWLFTNTQLLTFFADDTVLYVPDWTETFSVPKIFWLNEAPKHRM